MLKFGTIHGEYILKEEDVIRVKATRKKDGFVKEMVVFPGNKVGFKTDRLIMGEEGPRVIKYKGWISKNALPYETVAYTYERK